MDIISGTNRTKTTDDNFKLQLEIADLNGFIQGFLIGLPKEMKAITLPISRLELDRVSLQNSMTEIERNIRIVFSAIENSPNGDAAMRNYSYICTTLNECRGRVDSILAQMHKNENVQPSDLDLMFK